MSGDPQRGRELYLIGCQSCHGIDARGIKCARRRPTAVIPVPTEVGDFARTLGTMPLDAVVEPRGASRDVV